MNTTIYKITCTQGVIMSEQGIRFSLRPWGNNTDRIQGFDDGGEEYALPAGYEVAETADGERAIFRGSEYCSLVNHSSGRPQIISREECLVLSLV